MKPKPPTLDTLDEFTLLYEDEAQDILDVEFLNDNKGDDYD